MARNLYDIAGTITDFMERQYFSSELAFPESKWNPNAYDGDGRVLAESTRELAPDLPEELLSHPAFPKPFLRQLLSRSRFIKGTEAGAKTLMALIGVQGRIYPGWRIIDLKSRHAENAANLDTKETSYLTSFNRDFPDTTVAASDGANLFVHVERTSGSSPLNSLSLDQLQTENFIKETITKFQWLGTNVVFLANLDTSYTNIVVRDVLTWEDITMEEESTNRLADAYEDEQTTEHDPVEMETDEVDTYRGDLRYDQEDEPEYGGDADGGRLEDEFSIDLD